MRKLRSFFGKKHILITAGIALIICSVSAYALWSHDDSTQVRSQETRQSGSSKEVDIELEKNTEELTRLDITQEAINNSSPVSSSDGACQEWYYDDGAGHFSVTVRESDGSYTCVRYDLSTLQNYESDDGSTSVATETTASGSRKTTLKSTDSTGTTTTTTTVTNKDGSGYSSTEGGYWKICFDKSNSLCIYTNGTEMTSNFMSCKLQYEGGDYRLATPEEMTGRSVGDKLCTEVTLANPI